MIENSKKPCISLQTVLHKESYSQLRKFIAFIAYLNINVQLLN